jgi:hypothetical protein
VAVLVFPKVFYLVPLTGNQLWVLAGCALACIPLQVGLAAVIRRIRKKS